MKNNKKGFTIVELVIVIAIIAILAAVLIPTFSNVIKQANLSNDKQFVRNMNTTLAIEAIPNGFSSAGDAVNALNRNGYSGKYKTYSSGYHYCYSLEKNQMYLLDDENQIIFPEDDISLSSLWGLYTDDRTSATEGITKYVALTNITNSAHYNDVFSSGTYTIDLNGHYIAVDATGDAGNTTVSSGIMIKGAKSVSETSSDYTVVTIGTASRWDEVLENNGTKSGNTVTVKNKIFTERVLTKNVSISYVFEDCIFYGQGIKFFDGSGVIDGVTATLKDCQFIDIVEDQWAIYTETSLTIDGCTFTNLQGRGAVQLAEDSKDMVLDIKNCTFNGNAGEYPIIRFVEKTTTVARYDSTSQNLKEFKITNCTFATLNKATGIIGIHSDTAPLYNFTGNTESLTVTFSNNTIASSIPEEKYLTGGAEGNTLGTLLKASAN